MVFSFVFFDHAAGDTRNFTTPSGRAVTAGPAQPWTWYIADAGGLVETIGDEVVDGFEIGVSGNITNRWRMFGSFAFLDSEIIDDGPIALNEGKEFPNTPRNSFSLWSSYSVSPKVSIGGGATYVDKRFANVTNTVSIPEYWRYDAMASLGAARSAVLSATSDF